MTCFSPLSSALLQRYFFPFCARRDGGKGGEVHGNLSSTSAAEMLYTSVM